MQSYSFKFDPAAPNNNPVIQAAGNLFVYESGVTAPNGGDTRIRVKPLNRDEIILKPGQAFRVEGDSASTWLVSPYDVTQVLTSNLIIGSGDFRDSARTVTLDTGLPNTVQITNGVGSPVPVTVQNASLEIANDAGNPVPVTIQNSQVEITNDSGNRIPVSLDPAQQIGTSAPIMSYTNAYPNTSCPAGAAVAIVTAAQNLNGVIVEQVLTPGASVRPSLLAKATAPANQYDGDVLAAVMPVTYTTRQKVAAGKAVYLWNLDAGAVNVSALFTLL